MVSPFDHKYSAEELHVRVTVFPEQKVVGPLAVMVGAAGTGFTIGVY